MLWKGRANMGVRGAVGVGAGVEVTVEVEAGVRVEVEVGVLAGATRLRLKQDLDMCPGALRDHGHHRTGHAVAAYHQIAWTRIEKWDDNINICNGASRLLVCPNAYLRSPMLSSYRNPALSTKVAVPKAFSTYPRQPASSQYSPCSDIRDSSS